MDTIIAAPGLDDPSPNEAFPRRPAGLPRSNTFGDTETQSTQKTEVMLLQQDEQTQEVVAPDKLELDVNAGRIIAVAVTVSVAVVLTLIILGVYTCASLLRRLSSSSSSSDDDESNKTNSGVAARDRKYDIEMQAHINTPQRQQQHSKTEEERSPLSKNKEEDDYGDDDDETDEGEEGKEVNTVETGTARVAHLVARGSVSMVDIRRRTPRFLPSSRTVRDIASLPDLAWAQSLTTGGGRTVVSVTTSESTSALVSSVPISRGDLGGDADKKEGSTKTATTSSSSSSSSKRKGFRKMVKKNKVREWCERGMGMGMGSGGFGPYAGMY
ncbi:hypothetical protein VMCG_04576 [Cytospora schulzeri]|uniref:Transmembrane protein n=1 Tax=Cytospora schulzeri TaxID=448051 RepID=A0A423WS83_9PEZI|nr:hypothetical protein VMCG_04576 [Valsa malicola]